MHIEIIEQQITHSHMKTIQKSRNHNFHMRQLTNYRFLHHLLPTMQQLCSNQCNKNQNKRLEKVRITHVHVEIIEKHIKRWHMKTYRNNFHNFHTRQLPNYSLVHRLSTSMH